MVVAADNVGNAVSTHSRLKAAGYQYLLTCARIGVSTHSRLKAAGTVCSCCLSCKACFNTQPPEGGWLKRLRSNKKSSKFQHTAA